MDLGMEAALDGARLMSLLGLLLSYAGLCGWTVWRQRRRTQPSASAADVLVLHASQTGRAELLAQQTATRLQAAGTRVQLRNLADLQLDELRQARRAIWVVSTTGEGEPPDPALPFLRQVAREQTWAAGAAPSSQLVERSKRPATAATAHPWPPYWLLALGDRRYEAFCAFGAEIEALCHAHGAQALAPRIELDGDDPDGLSRWWQALAPLGAAGRETDPALDDQTLTAPDNWRLVERRWLNPGSSGAPLYLLALAPSEDRALPHWQAGDLALIQVPNAQGLLQPPRSYSIASLPDEGRLQLLVRQQRQPGGEMGLASGWLTTQAELGSPVALSVRTHPRFHARPEDLAQPALLIGAGSGLAGLRSHVVARAQAGAAAGPTWLLFGEREAAHDRPLSEELTQWLADGRLQRLDLVFSRGSDTAPLRYVQDLLRRDADTLRDWLARGARIYVCGSLSGLGQGVHDTLQALLGDEALHQLSLQGRYLRDLY